LRQIFETTGHVQNVKIIPDKNVCRIHGQQCIVLLMDPRLKASTTASWSTMILELPSVLCRLSMDAEYINRYGRPCSSPRVVS
jgi:nucleolysin TIA-1/TIAR